MTATRHFEKRGAMRLFRRFETRGSTLELAIGMGGEDEHRLSIPCASTGAAARLAGVWARWALDAGYAEVALPAGVLGVVATVESPQGPGRIRLDRRDDVQFLETPSLALDAGDRVLVTGVHTAKKRPPSYMSGSRLRARAVIPFPDPKWSAFKAAPEPGAAIKKSLARLAGRAILGDREESPSFPRDLRPGALIYSYEKGVHRFLRMFGTKRGSFFVLSEPVLTSNFRRASAPPGDCLSKFCEPIPARLAREIARRFGL